MKSDYSCFDVLLDMQFNDTFYNEIIDRYYTWYEQRVNEQINLKGVISTTFDEESKKCDIVRALHSIYKFSHTTILVGLDSIMEYCREMGVCCRVTAEAFSLAVAEKYFKEHEIPYMYRGRHNRISFSKSIDFVSWEALTYVFECMYGNFYTNTQYAGTDMRVMVSIYDDFIAPEMLRVKPYCRMELFRVFTDWCMSKFDDVVVEAKKVTFATVPAKT